MSTTTQPVAMTPSLSDNNSSSSSSSNRPPCDELVGYEDLMYYFDFTTKLRKLHRSNISQPTFHHYIKSIQYSTYELLKFTTTSTGSQLAHPDLNPDTQLLPQQMLTPPYASLHQSDISTQQLNTVLSFKPPLKPLNICKWITQHSQVQNDAEKKAVQQPSPQINNDNTTASVLGAGRLKKRKSTPPADDDVFVDIG